MKHYLDAAENAARAAGKLLRENFQRRQRIKSVAAHDINLEIDVQAQELISKLLLEEFPAASANDSSRAQIPRTRQCGARHGVRGVRTIRRIH